MIDTMCAAQNEHPDSVDCTQSLPQMVHCEFTVSTTRSRQKLSEEKDGDPQRDANAG